MRRIVVALAVLLAGVACGDGGLDEPAEIADTVDLGGGVQGLRIRYASTDVHGEPSEVTGLLVVPSGEPPPGGWPVIAYAHGTTGAADECAPSRDPELAGVALQLGVLAAVGFVAVATDYEGLGSDGPHPYLNGESAARSVVDSVRAARLLVPAAAERWAVVGHSQGGHAALFTAELASTLAPELELVGALAVAPVVDLVAMTAAPTPLQEMLLVLAVHGYLSSNDDVDADGLLTDEGQAVVEGVEDACDVSPPAALLEGDAAGFTAWLQEQAVPQQPSAVPVLVQQGRRDDVTPPDAARRAVGAMCALGDVVSLREYADADHITVVDAGADDAAAWLADRFADRPATATCDAR